MGKFWCYILFLVWFSYLIISSILLFTNGFLLNRAALNTNSTCTSYKKLSCLYNDTRCLLDEKIKLSLQDETPICLPLKARVVLLIIDAFRYDFALHDSSLKHPMHYQNKMPVINELLQLRPDATRLYEFLADPPTTTMQRLKALTTGSLPTFIDAGSNFATDEIGEDNIIDQLIKQNRKVVFLGDDTWIGLYPGRFARSYPYPSFNIWDLDTVDLGVTEHIYSELEKTDWDLLVGHYLGVDHCGHRYGPNHPEMARKLLEMNEVIRNVTNNLNEDVVLFVVGDHGMTATGDHGGESIDEVKSAMFVYSNLPLIQSDNKKYTVKQVDLIPTLSAILGIPIPFANLGTLVLNCLPSINNDYDWQELLPLIWMNVEQISAYIKSYSNSMSIFDEEKLSKLDDQLGLLKQRLPKLSNDLHFKVFLEDCMAYMLELRQMCEEKWVQFDSFSMSRGLLIAFLVVFFVYIIVDGIPTSHLSHNINGAFIFYLYASLLIGLVISIWCCYMKVVTDLFSNWFFVSGFISVFVLAILVIKNWKIICMNWYSSSKRGNGVEILCRLVLLVSLCSFFSNSFVVEEAYVSLFLLITMIAIVLFDLTLPFISKTAKLTKDVSSVRKSVKIKIASVTVVFCVLVRMSMYFWQCREEHMCNEYTLNATSKQSNSSHVELILALVSLGLLVSLTRMWLKSCGNFNGNSITIFLAQYSPTVIVVCCGGFWVLQKYSNKEQKLVSKLHADTFAWVVFGLSVLGLFMMFIKPLTLYILPKKTAGYDEGNAIPQLFRQVKTLFDQKESDNIPIVYGLGTVYSASFIICGVYVVLLFSLLLGDVSAPSAILLFFSALSVLIITSISRYEKAESIEQLLCVPTTSVLIWTLLSVYFFFGTGHQPTFPNIRWEAAFIGTGGAFVYNFIPATLILINTFGSYILMGFLLPLLLIAPFTLYIMVPSLCNKKRNVKKDLSSGDMLLYEKDCTLFVHLFVLCCKYLACHAIRVFASMLSATIHCRHLMVWKIFAPKLIFESIAMFITIPSVLLGYLLLMRVNCAVDRLVKSLNKQSR